MRIGPLTRIILLAAVSLGPISSAGAQDFYYDSGVPYISAPAHDHYWNDSTCRPYHVMPFTYINGCDEYIPSFDDWRTPGRG